MLDYHRDVLKKYSDAPVEVAVTPDDAGWIQYTGGTTGPPKGAMLSHRNAAHNIACIFKWLGWQRNEGVLLSGFPMFHIAGLTVCEGAINLGWTQVLIPNPRDTEHICKEMEKYKPTNMANVPSLYQMLMADPKFKQLDHSTLGKPDSSTPLPHSQPSHLLMLSILWAAFRWLSMAPLGGPVVPPVY